MSGTTVVAFRADTAEEHLDRFLAWLPDDVPVTLADLGTLDGVRRYRVGAEAWRLYTRQTSTRPGPTTNGALRLYACGECDVEAVAGALASHQRASGHEGRAEL